MPEALAKVLAAPFVGIGNVIAGETGIGKKAVGTIKNVVNPADGSIPPPTPIDPSQDPAAQAKIQQAQDAARRPKGMAATLLTGGAGITTAAPSARRTLLGA